MFSKKPSLFDYRTRYVPRLALVVGVTEHLFLFLSNLHEPVNERKNGENRGPAVSTPDAMIGRGRRPLREAPDNQGGKQGAQRQRRSTSAPDPCAATVVRAPSPS